MQRFVLTGVLALTLLLCACATSGFEFRSIPSNMASPPPTDPERIRVVEFEELTGAFAILGEYVVNLERAYNDERPDLFAEGLARIKQHAATQGVEALTMVLSASRVEERAPYKQPFGGIYALRMQVRALGIVTKGGVEPARADRNRDGRPDLWAYIEGGKKFFEFFDDDYDQRVDRMRRYIYDPNAHPQVELDYVPEASLTEEGKVARQETAVQVINEMGLRSEYLDTDGNGVIDFESIAYTRMTGAPLLLETKYP